MNTVNTVLDYRQPLEPPRATMDKVVAKRDYVLQKLVENKAKHDALFEASVQGYWQLARIRIGNVEKNFYKDLADYQKRAVKTLKKTKQRAKLKKEILSVHVDIGNFAPSTNLNLSYPENHSKDYERAIEMMKATIYDEVELSLADFNSYVMNDWSWRNNFVFTAQAYTVNNACYNNNWSTGIWYNNSTGCILPSLGTVYCSGANFTTNSLSSGIVNF